MHKRSEHHSYRNLIFVSFLPECPGIKIHYSTLPLPRVSNIIHHSPLVFFVSHAQIFSILTPSFTNQVFTRRVLLCQFPGSSSLGLDRFICVLDGSVLTSATSNPPCAPQRQPFPWDAVLLTLLTSSERCNGFHLCVA